MGQRRREKVERELDERFVIERYLKLIREICGEAQADRGEHPPVTKAPPTGGLM